MSLGLSVAPSDVREKVQEVSKGLSDKSWSELMEMTAQVTGLYLNKFREIAAAAPDAERAITHSMVIHESALHEFEKLELAGRSENSLDAVICQLHWPIPRPSA